MKKSFLLACLALCGITTVHAQSDNQATVPQPSAYVAEQRNLPGLHMGYSERGYRGFVEVGGVAGSGFAGLALGTSHGVQLMPRFYLGAGFSMDALFDADFLVPVFVDGRVSFAKHRLTPYIGVKVGYTFIYGGSYFNPSFGLSVPIKDNYGFDISLGYNLYGVDSSVALRLGISW